MGDGCGKWRWNTSKEACRLPRGRQALLYFFEKAATIPLRPGHRVVIDCSKAILHLSVL